MRFCGLLLIILSVHKKCRFGKQRSSIFVSMPQILSIIIPVYNEGKTIHFILDKIQKVELMDQIQKEIVIVDDCSKDETITAIES